MYPILALALLFTAKIKQMSKSNIHFTLSFAEPHAHYVDVQMEIHGFDSDYIEVKMPVWTPGSYLIREYSRHVESFQAVSENRSIAWQKTAKNTWRVANSSSPLQINYRIYGFEASVRTNFIDSDHAFISPAATFLYIDGHLNHPTTLSVKLPEQWSRISTGLDKVEDKENCFYAPDFDILFDSPLELGNQDIWSFDAAGIPHEFAMVGGGKYDKHKLTSDIQKIVEEETRIWGENPNKRYVFVTHNYQSAFGGLEHLNSTILASSRNAYSNENTYKNYLSLVAHEYFHLWNVKRLRPKALGPFDYEQENYTTGLWIMEGFTSYYDNLIIRRCGFFSPKEYLNVLSNDFNLVYNRPGYKLQSAALSSFDTWIKHYRPDENSANTGISYYNKGAILTVALDIKIIAETAGQYCLDYVLRAAYELFYKQENRGFEEDEFQTLAERVTGVDLSEIFTAAHSTKELDYNTYFHAVGHELIDLNEDSQELSLGIKTGVQDGKIIIKQIERGSGAWDAGLQVNDELIGINGIRLDIAGKELDNILTHAEVDEVVDVLVSRDGLLRTIHSPLRRSAKQQWCIRERSEATDHEITLGKIWLSIE
ncbi:Predicted metalloprotease, contains C-terminal PDZ domain [Sphingobacterium wenxiniae]|uniref:Predicted metalloprotease, contains C-terminal PDZ domain n=2 Tax=Sphingobacterium wenxiniae TaxID=683125 RepID=A0A1I6V2D9_9SPHI|nr:Predicted metalloprotease, contains C-terminal PDZ domain [Sphingobacterium wenxiniae]